MQFLHKIHLPALLILLTFYAHFFISSSLWITDGRDIPVIPFFDFLPLEFGKTIQTFFVFCFFITSILLVFKPDQKKYLLFFIIPAILMAMEDSLRLQPWLFQYLVMLILIAFEKETGKENNLRYLQWTIIAVYFWAGFNKLNTAFAWEIFPWFTTPFGIGEAYYLGFDNLNTFEMPAQNNIGFLIPVFEISIAVFLFISKTRWIGIIASIITHLVSLYAVGPHGHDWDHIVWPWNILMPILCLLLFYKKEDFKFSMQSHWSALKTKTATIILLFLFVGPLLAFLGKWDKGLSFYLYSGNSDEIEFYFEGFEEKLTETSMAEHLYLNTETQMSAMIPEYWLMKEVRVPMYQSERYMRKLGKHLCDCLDHPEKGGILIFQRSGFSSRQDTLKLPCKELQ